MFKTFLGLSTALFAAWVGTQTAWAQPSRSAVQEIVDTYANDAIENGRAVGVGVGVVKGATVVVHSGYGLANAANATPFASDTIFEIASNTKLFTTNLLGQDVFNAKQSLNATLGQLSAQVGTVQPLMSQVSLEELADFTAGLPDEAPLCSAGNTPGCVIRPYVPTGIYPISSFLEYFQNAVPANYAVAPPEPINSLPAPYVYSDFGVGLLGLILATAGEPIGSNALTLWLTRVQDDILKPLKMTSTMLRIGPKIGTTRIAAGYSLPAAIPVVANGAISSIKVTYPGLGYANQSAPEIAISGGAGAGATALAQLTTSGALASIAVTSPGANYVAPPNVVISGGGGAPQATARAIIENGAVVAFQVPNRGQGYTSAPTVTVSGGRAGSGADATGTALIANGQLTAITVNSGGTGYYPPLQVNIAPGAAESSPVPAWGAASALLSTVDDMNTFDSAALGVTNIGKIAVPAELTAGFQIAEKPYACQAQNSNLSTCPAGTDQSALSWQIIPADAVHGVPQILTKNGSLKGFSSQIVLIPADDLGVIVLINSDDVSPARNLATQIAYAMLYAGE